MPCWRPPVLIGFFAVSVALTPEWLAAQSLTAGPAPRYHWSYYASPATAISARIHAEADLVRAYGEASLDLAEAREIRARAVRQEIINSVEFVRAYWERKSIYEAERMKRYVAPLQRKEIQDSKTWAVLKDHPELNGTSIIEGKALNFLLDRMSGGVLAYQFSLANPTLDTKQLEQLQLPTATIHALQLRQDLPGGQRLVFRADEGIPLQVEWWPYLLREGEFSARRKAFESARKRAVAEARPGAISNEALTQLVKAFDDLERGFASRYSSKSRTRSVEVYQHYLSAQRFLQSLGGEILRLKTTGTVAESENLKFDGDNLLALLTHMSRNGLEFASSKPGEESAYHNVFRLMRDLYITVADERGSDAKK